MDFILETNYTKKQADYIKVHRDIVTNRNVYIYKDSEDCIKPPNIHRIILLDVLAEMKYCGFDVELFEIEKRWDDGKYRSDAFAIFTTSGRRYHFFIEVLVSHNGHNLKRYDELFKTGAVQSYLGKNFFPRILLISDRHFPNVTLDNAKVIQLNTKLDSFATILL